MKPTLILIVALFACRALGQDNATALVYLARANDNMGASYWVQWSNLVAAPSWTGSEAFPVGLRHVVDLAARQVAKRADITNEFDLHDLIISRVQAPRRQASANGIDPAVLSNMWFIAAEFLVQRGMDFSVSHIQREVLLLDGTVAKEIIAPYKEISAASVGKGPIPKTFRRDPPYEYGTGNSPSPGPAKRSASEAKDTESDKNLEAEYAGVRFRPPKVEWTPGSEFPLDIQTSADAALQRLRKELVSNSPLILQEIRIRRYQTIGVYELNDDPRRHWYWRIEFEFRPPRRGDGWPYEVVMLLDGSILLAREIGLSVQR